MTILKKIVVGVVTAIISFVCIWILTGVITPVHPPEPWTTLTLGEPHTGWDPVYVNSTTSFTLSLVEGGPDISKTLYRIDGEPWTEYSSEPFTLSGRYFGTHQVFFHSIDDRGNKEEIQSVVVFLDDLPPSANAGTDMVACVGGSLTLDGSSSSDNTGIQSYTWIVTIGNSSVTLNGLSPVHKFDETGLYEVELVVRDLVGHTARDTIQVDVAPVSHDFDDDLLPDCWEIEHFGSLIEEANGDPDNDGLTNLEEYNGGTDPLIAGLALMGGMWLILVLLMLVLLIITVLLFVARRRKPMYDEELPPPVEEEEEFEEEVPAEPEEEV